METSLHPFQASLIDAVEQIKQNRFRGSGHLPIQTYELFISGLTSGKSSLSQLFDSKEKYEQLKKTIVGLPKDTKFEAFSNAYGLAKKHREQVKEQLKVLSQQHTPLSRKQRRKIVTRYYAQQEAFAALATNLPPDYLINNTFLNELGNGVLSHDIKADIDLKKMFSQNVQNAAQKSGLVVSNQIVNDSVNKAVNIIRPGVIDPLASSLALLVAMVGPTNQSEEQEIGDKEEPIEEQGTTSPVSGALLGAGAFAVIKGREKDLDEFELEEEHGKNREKTVEDKKTIAPTPMGTAPIIPTIPVSTPSHSGLKSVFSSVFNTFGGLFKKSLNLSVTALSGGTSKLVQFGLKFLSFFGGGQTDVGDTLKKISIAVLLFVLLPIFLIFGLSFLDVGVLRPTALVSSPLISPTPAIFTTLTPLPVSPTPGGLTSLVPEGWPTQTGCVYVGPNGSTTHTGTTAQSIDVVSPNAYGRTIGKISRGLPVYATLDGIVSMVAEGYPSNQFVSDLGNRVEICHVDDFNTQYPYNSRRPFNCKGRVARYGHFLTTNPNLRVGAQVKKGGFLGTIDETGYSSIGDHVHYELRGFGNILSSLSISQLLKNNLEGCFGWSRCPKVCW